MDKAQAQFSRIRRKLRQITWMLAMTLVLEFILLVKTFSQ